jgi:hypothetical protein
MVNRLEITESYKGNSDHALGNQSQSSLNGQLGTVTVHKTHTSSVSRIDQQPPNVNFKIERWHNRQMSFPKPQTIEYSHALRKFCSQLSPSHARKSRRFYDIPWSKGVVHSESTNRSVFRDADNPLQKTAKCNESYNEMNEIDVDISKAQDEVWEAFIARDDLMDKMKKYNASNLTELKKQRDHENGRPNPADFQRTICSCMANPEVFTATWQLLELVHGTENLREYVKSRQWTPRELNAAKIDADLAKKLALLKEQFKKLMSG